MAAEAAQECALLVLTSLRLVPLPWLDTTVAGPGTEVVIVFTWLFKNPFHWLWRRYMMARGVDTALLYIPFWRVSLRDSAQELRVYLERHDLRNVTLVGISTGGLTCLLYTQQWRWDRVRSVVTVGAPLGGTPAARLYPFPGPLRELRPGSVPVRMLQGLRADDPRQVLCLSARLDELVPRWSSVLPGAGHRVVDAVGHNVLHSTCRATVDLILEHVKQIREGGQEMV